MNKTTSICCWDRPEICWELNDYVIIKKEFLAKPGRNIVIAINNGYWRYVKWVTVMSTKMYTHQLITFWMLYFKKKSCYIWCNVICEILSISNILNFYNFI